MATRLQVALMYTSINRELFTYSLLAGDEWFRSFFSCRMRGFLGINIYMLEDKEVGDIERRTGTTACHFWLFCVMVTWSFLGKPAQHQNSLEIFIMICFLQTPRQKQVHSPITGARKLCDCCVEQSLSDSNKPQIVLPQFPPWSWEERQEWGNEFDWLQWPKKFVFPEK